MVDGLSVEEYTEEMERKWDNLVSDSSVNGTFLIVIGKWVLKGVNL